MKDNRRTLLFAVVSLAALALLAAGAMPAGHSIASTTPFTVRWTAQGDDGGVGRATSYDLRYSVLPLTAGNFGQAVRINGLPAPGVAGTAEAFQVAGLTDGVLYFLAIKSADEAGNWSSISNVFTRPGQSVAVDHSALVLAFSSPWPNPAHDGVRCAISLPFVTHVQVDVYDVAGRHVRTLASGNRPAGTGELAWDLRGEQGQRIGNGVYFVRATLGSTAWTKRLVVV
jgi:hypothetical protein